MHFQSTQALNTIGNIVKVPREKIVEWVYETWINDDIIKSDTIIKSFKKCGISLNSDGSEDDNFVYPCESFEEEKNKKMEENLLTDTIVDNENLRNLEKEEEIIKDFDDLYDSDESI